jgi:hypothetical protein
MSRRFALFVSFFPILSLPLAAAGTVVLTVDSSNFPTSYSADPSTDIVASPSSGSLALTATGSGKSTYTVSSDVQWMTVSGGSGTINANGSQVTVNIQVTDPKLHVMKNPSQPYTGHISFGGNNLVSTPAQITVTLTLNGVDVEAPSQLPVNVAKGKAVNSSFTVNAYTVATINIASTQTWLSVVGNASGLNVNGSRSISIQVDATNLTAGSSPTGTLKITCTGTPCQEVDVTVTANVLSSAPLNPISNFTFNANAGGPNPPDQTVQISTSDGSQVGVSVSRSPSNVPWLGYNAPTSAPGQLVLQAYVGNNPANTYTATVIVTPANGTTPVSFTVTFVISAGVTITANPTALSFSASVGGADPAAQSVQIQSSDGSAVGVSVSQPANAGWLNIAANSTTTPIQLSVTPKVGSLTANTYSAAITITPNNGSPAITVNVKFVVAAANPTYYFPHLAIGAGFQTTLTYVNYSPQNVTCQTSFYSDGGGPLAIPFPSGASSSRTDNLVPGASIHVQTQASGGGFFGWAQAQCTGPVKASLLYRVFDNNGNAQGEAGVNASTAPATEFVTFAETHTGIAIANPSTLGANVTIAALDSNGKSLGSTSVMLQPNGHGAWNVNPTVVSAPFTGSVQITSNVPVVSLSVNAEKFPVFSSLPPGDLPASAPLASGAGGGAPSSGPANTYYFPHLAIGQGFQTALTLVNYSPQAVTCKTSFYSDAGAAIQVPFAGSPVSTRTDSLAAGASIHVETQAAANANLSTGWAQAQCTGPVMTSLLYRVYSGTTAQGEASINAETTPTTEFVTFAESHTGIAYANSSATPVSITVTALNASGSALASTTIGPLAPNQHGQANIGPLLGLNSSFSGSIQIVSTAPIVSLSLNAEAFPVFSSLPPGDLSPATPLAPGH